MPPFITASVAPWMGRIEDNLPTYHPRAIREQVPSPALSQSYISGFASFGVFSGCGNKDVVRWGAWHGSPLPTTGTTLFVSSWAAKPKTLQRSVLPRELSFVAGSQQRATDMVTLCAAAPEVKESAHFGSSFQPSVPHRLYCYLSLSWGGGSEFDFQLPGCRAIGCARETWPPALLAP